MTPHPCGLSISQAALVRHHRSELAAGIPPREETWRWGDVAVSRSTLVKLRNAGLIEQVDRREWCASPALANELASHEAAQEPALSD